MKYLLFFLVSTQLLINGCMNHTPSIINPIVDPIDTIKPDTDTHIIDFGRVSVLKNGQAWDASYNVRYFHSDSAFAITGRFFSGISGVSQTLGIYDIPCKAGKYQFEYYPTAQSLYPNQIPQSTFVMMYDGDQPIGDFLIDSLHHNHFIEIVNFDTLNNTAEGRFQIFLKRDPSINGLPFPGVPDSIAITEGKFYVPVKKY